MGYGAGGLSFLTGTSGHQQWAMPGCPIAPVPSSSFGIRTVNAHATSPQPGRSECVSQGLAQEGLKNRYLLYQFGAFLCPWLPSCPILQVREWFCVGPPGTVGAVLPGPSTQGMHGPDLQAGSEGRRVPASPHRSGGIKHLQ